MLSKKFIILTSSSFGQNGSGKFISIFERGDYKTYIRLEQWYGFRETKDKKYYWSDTLIIDSYLCISALEDGIGLFLMSDFEKKSNDRSGEIQYFNPWNKKVVKIIKVPNDIENLILIMFCNNVNSYEIVNKHEITKLYRTHDSHMIADIISDSKDLEYDINDYDIETDYFNALTDNQLESYDSFDRNLDDIDDSIGYQ